MVKVFLSYVGDAKPFVDAFAKYFFTESGSFVRVDWLIDGVNAGESVKIAIARRIRSADIFIAFICKNYPHRMAACELKLAARLRLAAKKRKSRRNLAIIPITLAQSGRIWWKQFMKDAQLGDMADQIFFIPGTDVWLPPQNEAILKIQTLRDSLAQGANR